MQHYRAYLLDEDGHISNAIDMECTDDEQAKECAKKYVSGHNAELASGSVYSDMRRALGDV